MEKVPLPKKTKIAARWINLLSIIGICVLIVIAIVLPFIFKGFEKLFAEIGTVKYFLGLVLGFFSFIFIYWSSYQLMRGKRWAWWACIVYLFLICLGAIITRKFSFENIIILSIVILVPLILLLIDRKNFWEIAV
jgi:hypothetical protein